MRIVILLLTLCLSFVTGCALTKPGKVVRVWQQNKDTKKWYSGNAAVIGPNRIVTAYHVVDLHNELKVNISVFPWKTKLRTFKITKLFSSRYEAYVFLECPNVDFKKQYIYNIGEGLPHKVITHRGKFLWKSYKVKKGDSGSPVINKKGQLVGIVYGHTTGRIKKPLFIPIRKK